MAAELVADSVLLARCMVVLAKAPLRMTHNATGVDRCRLRRIRDGRDQRDGRRGRPPLDPALVAAIQARLAAGDTNAKIGRDLGIRAATISAIRTTRHAKKPMAKLQPTETVLATPRRCASGHSVTIWPCRQCSTARLLEQLGGLVKRASELPKPAERTRAARGSGRGPNAYRLSNDAEARRREIHAQRLGPT